MIALSLPKIIQGGMGVGVSAWPLAKAVSKAGQLGVVAGTCLDAVLARRLQLGDPGEHMRRALAHFPLRDVARRIVDRYFVPGGKAPDAPFKANPVMTLDSSRHAQDLAVAGNFAEVFLAREGHDHPVGINYLEKVQLPTLPSLFGAMLAGVGFVLMGAGIPKAIPGILDDLAAGQEAELRVDVKDARPDESFHTHFDPAAYCGGAAPRLERPRFLAIIASAPLARMMAKKASGRVDGFVVEGPTAGGHNAPPRGGAHPGTTGEPVYGKRDAPDLGAIASLGLPFWLAGSYGGPRRLVQALELGAAGIQVGTAFAWCEESGIPAETKARVLALSRRGEVRVLTDAVASPTGFPFKVVQLPGTLSAASTYEARPRVCDLGYLRSAYRLENGRVGWRCPGEPEAAFVRKGGAVEATVGRKCICNALMSNIGLGQVRRHGGREAPIVTSGNDLPEIAGFLAPGATTYRAADVIRHLLTAVNAPADQAAPVAATPA
jgi:nitronate monooxygenase